MLVLYHTANYEQALRAQTQGFENVRNVVGDRSGIVFSDAQTVSSDLHDPTVFAVDVPEALAVAYEIEPVEGVRRFVLPAELVNRHGPRALVTDWSE
jgi:hypothetical protein